MFAEFNYYYKENKIISISMPLYSSYLVQLLDITLFWPLKYVYSEEINDFVRAFINYITKSKFFIAFKAAYNKTFTKDNIKATFRGAKIISWNPDFIISKLNVYIKTLVLFVPVSSQQ